jgi:hypothetical protein
MQATDLMQRTPNGQHIVLPQEHGQVSHGAALQTRQIHALRE